MKNLLILLTFSTIGFGQNQKLGIVLDSESKEPIEFVDVYNDNDNTLTNENGKYFLLSTNDSIFFSKLGYESLKTTFSGLQDTTFLNQKAFELSEVVLTNKESLFDKFKKEVPQNYPSEEYKERFFIRSTLRYNGDITRIQDIQGKLKRRTLLYYGDMDIGKKDFVFEVQNMRQIGLKKITQDDSNIYFIFRSLREILLETVQLNIVLDNFEIQEQVFDERGKIRIDFVYNGDNEQVNTTGYYIINLDDKAMLEFYLLAKPKFDFTQKKDIKYRVTRFEKNVLFDKNAETGKYVVKTAKIKSLVEVMNNEETFQTFFESEDILKSYEHFSNFKVRRNVNENKDVFKLSFDYDPTFWNNQNQLLLTDEMQDFIEKVGEKSGEFKVKSNMD